MKLDSAILTLNDYSRPGNYPVAAWSLLTVTIVYVAAVLSVSIYEPQKLIWLAVYPVVASEITGIGFGRLFLRSLWIIPLVFIIGIFNPVYDTQPAFTIGAVTVSRGWVSFTSVMLRGLLTLQALLVLITNSGFYDVCHTLRRWHMPAVIVTQLLFTYRYMGVLLEEARSMHRAREARGFGRKSYPLKMWGRFVGQLLLRSVDRARRINNAMLARGFDGTLPMGPGRRVSSGSWTFLAVSLLIIAIFRFVDFSSIIFHVAPLS